MPDNKPEVATSEATTSPSTTHKATAWTQVGVGAMGEFLSVGLFFYSIPILLPYLARDVFNDSMGQAALVQSTLMVFGAIASPFIGKLIDSAGVKKVMAAGAFLFGMGFFAMGNAETPLVLLLSVALPLALGSAMMGGIAPAKLVTEWFANSNNKGMALGVAGVGISMGGVVFPYVISHLIGESSWREALQVYGVLCLFAVPFFYLMVESPKTRSQDPVAEAQDDSTWGFRELTAIKPYMRIVIVFALQFTVVTALFTHSSGIITSNLGGDSASLVPTILAITAATAVAGKLVAGFAAKIFKRTGLVIAGFCLMQMLGIVLIVIAPTTLGAPLYFVGFACWGLGYGSGVPLLSFALSQAMPAAAFGRALGYSRPILVPFQLFAPPALGFLFDQTGSYNFGISLMAVGILLATAIAATLRFPDSPEAAAEKETSPAA